MEEKITAGWLEGWKIVDDIIIGFWSNEPAFEKETNDEFIRQLRVAGFVKEK